MEEEQDIQSDIVKQKQLRDAQENQEFDRSMDAYRRGRDLTDEQRKERLLDNARLKGNLLEAINNPLAKSIAFETGANVALDTATGWFMPAPWLYAGINFVGSSAINIAAQRMRGQRGINFGEVGASGLISTVPYMNPAAGRFSKLVGQQRSLQRAAVGGGVMAVAHQQIEAGVNEGRVISPTEAAVGLGLGAAAGTAFKEVGDQLGKRLKFAIDRSPLTAQRTGTVGAQVNPAKAAPKISTNEKLKQALIANEVIELPAAYPGGPHEIRLEADYFDVSAALIGGGVEDTLDAAGNPIKYNRGAVTEFGGTKSEKRDIVYNHIKNNLKRRKKDGTGTNINRKEFDQYAREQIAAEEDLRNAIKLMNLREYAAQKGIELGIDYPTAESQLKFVANINKAKHKPRRSKNKAGNYTETPQQYQKKVKKWEKDTEPFQQYTDYKETFDYGHIISAKTGYRKGDFGMNRRSNTEIEPAYNIEFRDPYTRQLIEILQEGNRPRGSRREHLLAVQRMRGASSSVVEDYVKWKDMKDGNPVRLDKILDKFMPLDKKDHPEIHDKFLKFIEERFYEERKALGSIDLFTKDILGIPEDFKNLSKTIQLQIRKVYDKEVQKMGNVIGQQQYDQGEEWIRNAIDDFIALPAQTKVKRRKNRSKKALQAIEEMENKDNPDLNAPRSIEELFDMLGIPYTER